MRAAADEQRVRPPPKQPSRHGDEEAAQDLCAGEDGRGEPRDAVRAGVAVQLQEIRLGGVERVEADSAREWGSQHEPADGRIAPPTVDRAAQHAPHLADRVGTATRAEADVVHEAGGNDERHAEHRGPKDVRDAEVGRLRDHATEDGPNEHRGTADGLRPPEDRLEAAREPGRAERVDEPGFRGAGEEREAETQQDRGQRPPDERGVDLPHHEVQEGRGQQGHGPEQEREAPAARVGDDARRHFEDDLADREEGVRGERLGVAQARVEQEERVDAPDERRRQRRQQGEHEVRALDGSGVSGHGPENSTLGSRVTPRPGFRVR